MQDLCTIIVPVHNTEMYVADAVKSILAQTYTNFELLLIDDASTDRSHSVIQNFTDSRIRHIRLKKNVGVTRVRNFGLDKAKGKYIAFCDSDDIWLPEKLQKEITRLEKEKADLAFTAYEMVDASGNHMKNRFISENLELKDLLKENIVCFSSVVLRKESLGEFRFKENWRHEDYVFLLDAMKEGRVFTGLNELLVRYRVHGKGRSANKINAAKHRWKIYREYMNLGFFSSCRYFIFYALNGIRKYK